MLPLKFYLPVDLEAKSVIIKNERILSYNLAPYWFARALFQAPVLKNLQKAKPLGTQGLSYRSITVTLNGSIKTHNPDGWFRLFYNVSIMVHRLIAVTNQRITKHQRHFIEIFDKPA
ncbi:MAG: hypothetical protein POG74_05050 [Acidocella sp.]|nr:hypothetical protein [Acidocella sp.]